MAVSKRDPLLIIGLVAVIVFVVVATIFEPDALSGIRDRFVVLGILFVSVIAQWRGTRVALVAAVVSFIVIGAAQPRPQFLSFAAPTDVFVDLFIFLAVALVQGVQTGHLREREQAAEESERRMSLVGRLGSRLVPGGNRPAVSDLLDELAGLVGARHAVLLVADATGGSHGSEAEEPEWLDHEPDARRIAQEALSTGMIVGNADDQEADTGSAETAASGLALPVMTGGPPLGAMYISRRKDRRPFPARDLEFMRLVSNELASYLERERLQEEVAETAAQIAGDRLKSNLVSSVSHEIRTPLAAATAIVSVLAEEHSGGADSRLREGLASAQASLELLNRQIADLLDISRLETSSWEPNLEWNDLRDLCEPLFARVSQHLRHRLRCKVPGEMPLVRFDPVQLMRALGHIVENALAYSDEDSPVTVGGSASADRVRIWVEDEGPGLSSDDKEVIFEKFSRGSVSSLSPHGTGLGLAIAQEIVSYHGGVILVEDVKPHGARFVIELRIVLED